MTDDIITRNEAIERMARGEKCETNLQGHWRATKWSDFDATSVLFRIPPKPRRLAREWWIWGGEAFTHNVHREAIHVREVLPGDVVLQRMTEQEWLNLHAQAFGSACMPSALVDFARALGLIGEGS